jgi:hypothetical protein
MCACQFVNFVFSSEVLFCWQYERELYIYIHESECANESKIKVISNKISHEIPEPIQVLRKQLLYVLVVAVVG